MTVTKKLGGKRERIGLKHAVALASLLLLGVGCNADPSLPESTTPVSASDESSVAETTDVVQDPTQASEQVYTELSETTDVSVQEPSAESSSDKGKTKKGRGPEPMELAWEPEVVTAASLDTECVKH